MLRHSTDSSQIVLFVGTQNDWMFYNKPQIRRNPQIFEHFKLENVKFYISCILFYIDSENITSL